jgi:predicted regulator of Ras-like GTPase activity (Roadblock/LC7/MglB family)
VNEPRLILCRLDTEFGRELAPLVATIPGARGAVLSDSQGDAIDFAHHPADISELDVQLLGAQIGQAMLRLSGGSARHHLHDPAVLVEGTEANLVASAIAGTYILALLLDRRANLAVALSAFVRTRARIARLLGD